MCAHDAEHSDHQNFLISPTPSERHFAKNSILVNNYPPYGIVVYMYMYVL